VRRRLIAVAGSGDIGPDDVRWRHAEDLGAALVDAGYRVLCGGRGGVSEAVAKGARASARYVDGDVVGVLPADDGTDANPFVDVVVPTGLGHWRNGLVAHGDAVVAIGGGAGTLAEIALAWVWDRPIIAFRTEGWSGVLADTRLDDRARFPERPDDRVYGVAAAAEAVGLLGRLLERR
jgi:uncharacterized protein (TIGR00725 family)